MIEFDRRKILASALSLASYCALPLLARAQHGEFDRSLLNLFKKLGENGVDGLDFPVEIAPIPTVVRFLTTVTALHQYPNWVNEQSIPISHLSGETISALPPINSPDQTVKITIPENSAAYLITRVGSIFADPLRRSRQQWLFIDTNEGEKTVFENAGGIYQLVTENGPLSILLNFKYSETERVYIHLAQLMYPRRRFNAEDIGWCTAKAADISGPDNRADGVVDEWDWFQSIMGFKDQDPISDINNDGVVNALDSSCVNHHFGREITSDSD